MEIGRLVRSIADISEMQIGADRLEHAFEIEEIQIGSGTGLSGGAIAPEIVASFAGQEDRQASELVGQDLAGLGQVKEAQLEEKHVGGVTQIGGGIVEYAGEQRLTESNAFAADGILQREVTPRA